MPYDMAASLRRSTYCITDVSHLKDFMPKLALEATANFLNAALFLNLDVTISESAQS